MSLLFAGGESSLHHSVLSFPDLRESLKWARMRRFSTAGFGLKLGLELRVCTTTGLGESLNQDLKGKFRVTQEKHNHVKPRLQQVAS